MYELKEKIFLEKFRIEKIGKQKEKGVKVNNIEVHFDALPFNLLFSNFVTTFLFVNRELNFASIIFR